MGTLRTGWANLTWKALLAIAILFLMSVGSPLSWIVAWGILNPIPAILIVWGGLVVGVAASNLLENLPSLRVAWIALAVGAYLALTIPGVLIGRPDKMVDALAPVTALTLVAHLGRQDLQRALRDWALVMGLSLYAALGVQAMWLVVSVFGNDRGPLVFLVAVLLPPLIFEAVLLLLRRAGPLKNNPVAHVVGLAFSTALAVVVFAATQLNTSMEFVWRLIFGLLVGILIGTALLIGLLTEPLVSAASGSHSISRPGQGLNLAGALVELSHEPILISLAIYIPLRLLFPVSAQ
jgi:hypothetical protein